MSLVAVSDPAAFAKEIASGVTLVDIWAPWCGPCKALTPTIESISTNFHQVKFLKVNADEPIGAEVSNQFAIMSLPTLLLFSNGKLVNKSVGNISPSKLRDFIESAL